MIQDISIQNFKSIIDDHVRFNRLTVLVGANGSGKSNLVKALEFLSAIPSRGILNAVSSQGGFSGLIPKAIPKSRLRQGKISLQYTVNMFSPPFYDGPDYLPITANHLIEMGAGQSDSIRITNEKVSLNQGLAVEELKRLHSSSDYENGIIPKENLTFPSSFILERGKGGITKFQTIPPITKDSIPDFLEWLGFGFLKDRIHSKNEFSRVIQSIINYDLHEDKLKKKKKLAPHDSFLNPTLRTYLDHSDQFNGFLYELKAIRRYDLLLNELRIEQKIGSPSQLSASGDNVPSVLRHLKSPDFQDNWERITDTFGSIAPHIETMKSSQVRAGKEYVEFVESIVGRGIESWESSDGSLRALAILIALETHPPHTTMIIEEPEQNLHPWAVHSLMDHIREVIEKRHLQVVITTHSQQVLERVKPDEVLVASRTTVGGTKFKNLQDLFPDSDIMMGEVGQLWVKGLLGGVPTDV